MVVTNLKKRIMKNLLIVNLLITLFLFGNKVSAEKYNNIESFIKVKMSFNDSTFNYIPYLKIRNKLIFSNYTNDTLSLSLNKKAHTLSFIEGFDVQNLKFKNNISKRNVVKINFNKATGVLKVIKMTSDTLNFTININYLYKYDINDFFKSIDNKFNDISCELNNSLWYLYNRNIELKTLEVISDSNFLFFCNANLTNKEGNKSVYDISSIDERNKLFFSIVNRGNYICRIVNVEKTKYGLYLLKSDSLDLDTISKKIISYKQRKSCFFDNIERSFKEKINYITSFYNKDIDINIIETNWNNSIYSFGRGYRNNMTDDGYIRCDSRLLINSGITHECLHFLCDVLADYSKDGYLFLSESIIETFTIYSQNKNKSLDSVFKEKYKYYLDNFDNNSTSLFDVKKNIKDFRGIIYYKTPYILYEFSKSNNKEKFWSVFSSFMKLKLEKATWGDFENHFYKHGYTNQQMRKLKDLL